jgi:Ser/Thr protein kinase RdoA (MazF antagonist)
MPQSVLPVFGLKEDLVNVDSFGSGLINNTWKVITKDKVYILQRINHSVFKEPASIAHNIKLISNFLKAIHPEYLFVAPLTSNEGEEMIYLKEGYFRLFPFVTGSHSKDVVETPAQAYEAATQFGRFTRLLSGMNVNQLKITIPRFHDLDLRYQQFESALENGNPVRIREAATLIAFLKTHSNIVDDYKKIVSNPEFKLRVTHHDTKISNVLFSAEDKGICVIDLDTVMPGYFISDVGDMMRTYLSPVSEEEKDFAKIEVREDFYRAIVQGYYDEMKGVLSETEKRYFFYSGKFMIYMQAIRFLTDYLNNDVYYGARYPGHNFIRAGNQAVLLQRYIDGLGHKN